MLIVLIGIIAVYAAPRLGNLTDTKSGVVDKLRADIAMPKSAMTESRYGHFNGSGGGAPASAIV